MKWISLNLHLIYKYSRNAIFSYYLNNEQIVD